MAEICFINESLWRTTNDFNSNSFSSHINADSQQIKNIKNTLNSSDTDEQDEGLDILLFALKNCDLKYLESNIIVWLKTLVHQFINNNGVSFKLKEKALYAGSLLFYQLNDIPAIKSQVKKDYANSIFETVLNYKSTRCSEAQLIFLRTILIVYPHSIGNLKLKMEKFTLNFLIHEKPQSELVYEAATTLPFVVAMGNILGSSGNPENSFAKTFCRTCCRLLITCHKLLDFLLMEEYKGKDIEKELDAQSLIEQIPDVNGTIAKRQKKSYEFQDDELTPTKAATYIEIMMFTLQKLLTTSTKNQVEIPINQIMELLSRIINHCSFSNDELLPHIDGNYTWHHIIFFATSILESLAKTCKEPIISKFKSFMDIFICLLDETTNYKTRTNNGIIRKTAYRGLEALLKNCSTIQPQSDNKNLTKLLKFIKSDCENDQQVDKLKAPMFDFERNGYVKVSCLRVLHAYVLNYGKHISGENFQSIFTLLFEKIFTEQIDLKKSNSNQPSFSLSVDYRFCLYNLLKASLLNCSFELDPPINYSALALKQGLMDPDQRISDTCKEALSLCSLLSKCH